MTKIKLNYIYHDPRIFLIGVYPREILAHRHQELGIRTFRAALFINPKT